MTVPVLAILYLILAFLAAFVIVQRLFREFPVLVRFAGAFVIGIVITGWTHFAAALLLHLISGHDATFYGAFVAMGANAAIVVTGRRELRRDAFWVSPPAIAGLGAAVLLSAWVMLMRLGGSPLQVSSNTWGDTALHIGIARSFSEGDNFPPELPIFAGETIRYHFGFDFFAGALERLGLPIEWAFNLPGAWGFAAIMVLVFAIAQYLWRSAFIGVLAAALFITNGSLAFLRYFDNYPTVLEALNPANWWNHAKYEAIAPYQDGEVISIFWTLNPFLTQTHLIVSMALVLFVGYALLRQLRGPGAVAGDPAADFTEEDRREPLTRTRAVALGLISGAAFWLNGILFFIAMLFFAVLLYAYSGRVRQVVRPSAAVGVVSVGLFVAGTIVESDGIRTIALVLLVGVMVLLGPIRESWPFFAAAGAVALPQLVWLKGGASSTSTLFFHSGYLVENFSFVNPQSYLDFLGYWWLNLGLVGPLLVLAAVVCRRADRGLLAAVMAIFVFGNLAAFGNDVGGHNHKVFNLWEIMANLFAAYAVVWLAGHLWRGLPRGRRSGVVAGRTAAVVMVPAVCVLLVLSGLLDFMTLKNDPRYGVFGDLQPAVTWIAQNTSPDAVFLTAHDDVYTVPTLAGRSVYLGGFSIWAPGMGYDTEQRKETITAVYSAPDRSAVCERLRGTGIDYIQISSSESSDERFPQRNPDLFPGDFVRIYSTALFAYYDVNASCGTETITAAAG